MNERDDDTFTISPAGAALIAAQAYEDEFKTGENVIEVAKQIERTIRTEAPQMTTDEHIKFIQAYDYKLVTRAEFEAATDKPKGLQERAAEYPGAFVVYDPLADDDGFMIIGNDKTLLAREAYEHIDSLL